MSRNKLIIILVALILPLSGCLDSQLAETSAGGGLSMYSFNGQDAAGSMDDTGGDVLVDVELDSGDSILWSEVFIRISVDYGQKNTCGDSNHDSDDDSNCVFTSYGNGDDDSSWELGEGITISEGDYDLCDGANGGGCDIDVEITNWDGMMLGSLTLFADGNY